MCSISQDLSVTRLLLCVFYFTGCVTAQIVIMCVLYHRMCRCPDCYYVYSILQDVSLPRLLLCVFYFTGCVTVQVVIMCILY